MMRSQLSFLFVAFVALLAGNVAAQFNVNVTATDIFPVSQFLDINDQVMTDCASTCQNGTQALAACTDNACFCSNATVAAVQTCEQCMFERLIIRNIKPDDPRAGQTSALAAYQSACVQDAKINSTLSSLFTVTTATLGDAWEGPFGQGLNPAATGVVLVVTAILGVGLITVVNTM